MFIHDSLLDTYTPINQFNYQYHLGSGDYLNRFYLTFTEDNSLSITEQTLDNIVVKYLMAPDEIYIKTPLGVTTQKVELVDLLGQVVQTWENTNPSNELRFRLTHISESHYVVKVQTSSGTVRKKITVKF